MLLIIQFGFKPIHFKLNSHGLHILTGEKRVLKPHLSTPFYSINCEARIDTDSLFAWVLQLSAVIDLKSFHDEL